MRKKTISLLNIALRFTIDLVTITASLYYLINVNIREFHQDTFDLHLKTIYEILYLIYACYR